MEPTITTQKSDSGIFKTLLLSFTAGHLVIDLLIWGILYTNFREVFRNQGALFFLMIFAGAAVSFVSYILSIMGIVKIARKKYTSVIIICIVVNIILLVISLFDPNSLYNFHT